MLDYLLSEPLPPVSLDLPGRLRLFRRRHGLTQKQVAFLLQIDRTAYSCYENGKAQPKIDALAKLSLFYHVSMDDLIGIERA